MIFHSYVYLIFLSAIVLLYWRLPRLWQGRLLIGVSVYFYGAVHPWFLLPFLFTMLVDYAVAIKIDANRVRKTRYLLVSVISNLTMLGIFKYWDFFASNVNALLGGVGLDLPLPVLHLILPVGISFYTFQSLGYVIDVWRGDLQPCRKLDDFVVFVSFFPQLVAGPIDRHGRLLRQVEKPRQFDFSQIPDIFTLIIWGYFKKLVIADNVGIIADKVFAHSGPPLIMILAGTLAFTVQIFADFSAYTDIARGSAKLLGFELVQNFNHPWLASSPSDFWRRWHMSLSSWFRDYIYIPLGGSRVGLGRQVLNILITFCISGLWHGASWNFVLWGVYWGALIAIERLWSALGRRGLPRLLATPAVFALSMFGWFLFREHDLYYVVQHIAEIKRHHPMPERAAALHLIYQICIYAMPIFLHGAWDGIKDWKPICSRPAITFCVQTVVSAALLALILTYHGERSGDFIYFQF